MEINMLIAMIIVSLIIFAGVGIGVAVEQADAQRSMDCDSRQQMFFRYGTVRSLPR
jgi:hypothetical protein